MNASTLAVPKAAVNPLSCPPWMSVTTGLCAVTISDCCITTVIAIISMLAFIACNSGFCKSSETAKENKGNS